MSGVEATGRASNTVSPGQTGTQASPTTTAPGRASPASPLAVPVGDAMLEARAVQPQGVTVQDLGLGTGRSANPFALLLRARTPAGAPASPRLVADGVPLDVDLVPPEKTIGKLAGFEKQGLATDSPGPFRGAATVREGVMLLTADALPTDDAEPLAQTKTMIATLVAEEGVDPRSAEAVRNRMFAHKGSFPMGMDVHAFVQAVLREAYLFQNELLFDKSRRMQEITAYRKALRKKKLDANTLKLEVLDGEDPDDALVRLSELLGFDVDWESDTNDPDKDGPTAPPGPYPPASGGDPDDDTDAVAETTTDGPAKFNPNGTREEKAEYIENYIQELENELASTGEDGQMMQLEMQQLLQKQQQFLTMMSNISKMMHDVAMSIIRKIGG